MPILTPTPAPDAFNPDSFFRGVELAFSTFPLWVWLLLIALAVVRMVYVVHKRSERQQDVHTRERNHEGTENTER